VVSPLLVVALVHAGVATAFTIVCLVASVVRATPTSRRGASRVFLLRPMEIASPAIVARLLFDARAYSGELVRVWCAPVAIAVPEGVRVAVSGLADDAAQNRKSAHLAAGLALVAAELDERSVVVHADSDVRLLPGDLDALILALDEGLALSFAPPSPSGRLAQAIIALSPQAFAVIAGLSRITGSSPAIAGKLVAMRAPLLDAIGGYACVMHTIGDDVALVEAAKNKGARVLMSDRAALVENHHGVLQVFDQLTRWLRVVRAHRAALLLTYPFLMAPLPIAALLCALANAWPAFFALVVARLLLAVALTRGPYRGRASMLNALLAPVADTLVLLAAARASLRGSIEWAGRRYRVGAGGRILAVERIDR